MEIRIGNKKQNPKSCYILYLNFMHGDGDGDQIDDYVYPTNDIERLKKDLITLNDLHQSVNPDKYGEIMTKHNVLSYSDTGNFDTLKYMMIRDATSGGDCYAYLERYWVRYFNEDGIEFDTILEF